MLKGKLHLAPLSTKINCRQAYSQHYIITILPQICIVLLLQLNWIITEMDLYSPLLGAVARHTICSSRIFTTGLSSIDPFDVMSIIYDKN